MRLFFALWPERPFQQYFAQLAHQLGSGKRVRAEQLHLTLAFLGEVEPSRVGALFSLAEGVHVAPFDLTFDQLAYWKKPQVLWAGCTEECAALQNLVTQLQLGLQRLSLPTDTRPYTPHLTLLRKVATRPELPQISPMTWHVHGFCLVKSELSAAGPRYVVLKSWRFNCK